MSIPEAQSAWVADTTRRPIKSWSLPLNKNQYFIGLFILAFTNGIAEQISTNFLSGAYQAIFETFGISVIAWAACWLTITLLCREPEKPVDILDLVVGVGVVMLTIIPDTPFTWVGLTGLALYTIYDSSVATPQRRGGLVMLALTVPMFWSRLLFFLLSKQILAGDAILASFIVGTKRVGNTFSYGDNWGILYIAPGCSSLANVSFAVLTWVLFTQALGSRISSRKVGLCLAACTGVILINVTRIGLIGDQPQELRPDPRPNRRDRGKLPDFHLNFDNQHDRFPQ